MSFLPALLPRTVILAGLASWMTIAVFNNITDQETNLFNLETMLTMRLLIENDILGNGLEWRALSAGAAPFVLFCVIGWQLATAAALWWSALAQLRALIGATDPDAASLAANVALSMFTAMWLVFLCGGLWFGYWMKQGPIQGVHLALLIVSLGSMIFVNQPLGRVSVSRSAQRTPGGNSTSTS